MSNEAPTALRLGAAQAALGSGLAEVTARVLAVVLTIVTARTLEPRDVGVLGLAVIIIGLISMIGYYPETAAVAAPGEGEHNRRALTALIVRILLLVVLLGMLATAFHLLTGYLIGGPEGATVLRRLVLVLAWVPVLECISGYPEVILQRKLDLRFLALAQVIQVVMFVSLATILLLRKHGCVAVAWSNLAGTTAVALVLWARLLGRGWLCFDGWPTLRFWRETVRESSRVFLGGFGGYVSARLDNVLVAAAMGPAVMSYYSTAWTASRTPSGILSKAINFVLVPTLARIQDDDYRLERGIRECLHYSYVVLAPICAALFVCAWDLVTIILGPKWVPVVPALRLMSITVLVGPLLDCSNALLIGTGRAQLSGVSAMVRIAGLMLLVQPFAHRWNLMGAAWADLITAMASAMAMLVVLQAVNRNIKWPVASAIVVPAVAAIGSGLVAWRGAAYIVPGPVRLLFQMAVLSMSYLFIFAAIGGRKRLMNLAALLRSAVLGRIAAAESHG